MKVIPLTCNHCGAPLEVAAKARFVTCGFCNARLTIQHTGSSYSTEVLEDIQETTQRIAEDIKQIKSNTAIERLDQQWERTRSKHLVTGKHGQQSLPAKSDAIVGGVLVAVFGLFWTIMACGITGAGRSVGAPGFVGIFPLFGVLFIAFGIFNAIRIYQKAEAFDRDKARYQRQRHDLQRQSTE